MSESNAAIETQPTAQAHDAATQCLDVDTQDRRAARLLAALFLLLTILLGLLSDGVHHDDDLTHFLFARWSARFPGYLLHVWGRPGMTVPMALVSFIGDRDIGWHLARYLSAMVSFAAALLAAGYARNAGLRPSWPVVALCYLQPFYTMLASTTLTENFTAFYLIGALVLAQRRHTLIGSAVFSLVLLTRHEAIIFLPLWWLVTWRSDASIRAKITAAFASLWAPALHNVLHAWAFEHWPIAIFFRPTGSTEYLPQGWLSYVPPALYAVGPLIGALAVAGVWPLLRRGLWHAPAFAGSFFLVHASIKALGLYASGGYPRFMVAVAPLTAVLAWAGGRALFSPDPTCRERGIARICATAAWLLGWMALEVQLAAGDLPMQIRIVELSTARLLVALVTVAWLAVVWMPRDQFRVLRTAAVLMLVAASALHFFVVARPLQRNADQRLVAHVVDWLDRRDLASRPIFAANPWFAYELALIENPRADKGPELLNSMPVGTLFLWDSAYTGSDFHGISQEAVHSSGAFHLLHAFQADGGSLRVEVFEKIVDIAIPARKRPRYPPPITGSQEPIRGIYYVRESD